MAPDRILTKECNPLHYKQLYVLIILSLILTHCAATERVTGPGERDSVTEADSAAISTNEEIIDLEKYRNKLKDHFTTQQHDIPEAFLKTYKGDDQVERDPFDGFRIQLLSTRTVALADSAAKNFRIWADTSIAGYMPQTYINFKPPYYKVHAGDFHNRERAIDFSRLVQRQFPDAWVVHDRINPYLVPADSIEIRLVEKARSLNKK